MSNNRLEMRIEKLQAKEVEKPKESGGGWGSSFFSGGSGKELEELKSQLTIIQEELEAKISENMHVHEQNFETKQKLTNIQDQMDE